MTDDKYTVFDTEEINLRNDRQLVDMYDELQEADAEWTVSISAPALTDAETEKLEDAVLYTIGSFRHIVGKDRYIPSSVYWSLVSEYAEEVIDLLEDGPEWADDDLDVFLEVVMPTEMSRFHAADPIANFFTLCYSRHRGEGWLTAMTDDYYGTRTIEGVVEYVEERNNWKDVLSQMAMAACIQDVAQEVRGEGYEVDLGPLGYLD